jgi:hypothetical protein
MRSRSERQRRTRHLRRNGIQHHRLPDLAGYTMSRWTELQETIRHRFGMNVEAEPYRQSQTEQTPLGSPRPVDTGTGGHSTPCSWPDCELPAEGIVCRTHRVDAAVLLLEDDLLRLGTDWIFWIQEMRPL